MATTDIEVLLNTVARPAGEYRRSPRTMHSAPRQSVADCLAGLGGPLPETGTDPAAVIDQLIKASQDGLVMQTSPRFFGWVMGSSHPAGVAADALSGTWGQMGALAPAVEAAEQTAQGWLLELLDLPRECSIGFVTGATIANFTALAAARGEVLRRVGWEADEQGLFGAPPITVIIGAEAHITVFMGLQYLGLGHERVIKVKPDGQGRMDPAAFAEAINKVEGPVIVILQAGHINSGAFDDFETIIPLARQKGAWVHVDGAFGLWARAPAPLKYLTKGIEEADSWATDGHKWLQVPYDCGFTIVRHELAHRRAMTIAASYLPGHQAGERLGFNYAPELSRAARGNAVWAVIKALGREGVAEMVQRHCRVARQMAQRLSEEPGITILNDVVLNQVAVRFGADQPLQIADELTKQTISQIQGDGICFAGGAKWFGREIMRISVTSMETNEEDGRASAEAMIAAWRKTKRDFRSS